MEHLCSGAEGHDGDEAVGHRADRLASASTSTVERGRIFEVDEPTESEHLAAEQQATKALQLSVVTRPGQHLHHDDLGRGQSLLAHQELAHTTMHRAAGGAEELDPRRGVDQDHGSGDEVCVAAHRVEVALPAGALQGDGLILRQPIAHETMQGELHCLSLRGEPVPAHHLRHERIVELDVGAGHAITVHHCGY